MSVLAAAVLVLSSCAYANSGRPPTETKPAPSANVTVTVASDLAADVPSAIRESGVLVFATEASYPPMEFIAEDELTIAGADVDLGNAIATTLGLESRWINATFASLLPGVANGRFDTSMSALTVTPKRLQQVTMVTYLNSGTAWAVQRGNPDDFDPTAPCGGAVAVQTATVQADMLTEKSAECESAGQPPIAVTTFALESDVYRALIDGRVQALVADSAVVRFEQAESEGAIELVGQVTDLAPFGIAIAQSNAELADSIAAALQRLMTGGAYADILEFWELSDDAIDTPEILSNQ